MQMPLPIRSQNSAKMASFTFRMLNKSRGLHEALRIKANRAPKHVNPEAEILGVENIRQTVSSDHEIP